MPCRPVSYYGKAKLLATKHLIKLHKKKAFPFTVVRLYQVYSPGRNKQNNTFLSSLQKIIKLSLFVWNTKEILLT